MPINIQDNFRVNVGLPIDSRIVASGSSGRSAIPTHTRYDGLRVFDTFDRKTYIWNSNTSSWGESDTAGTGVVTSLSKWSSVNGLTSSGVYFLSGSSLNVGKVGINATNPQGALEVRGDGGAAKFVFHSYSTGIVLGQNFYNNGSDQFFTSGEGSSAIRLNTSGRVEFLCRAPGAAALNSTLDNSNPNLRMLIDPGNPSSPSTSPPRAFIYADVVVATTPVIPGTSALYLRRSNTYSTSTSPDVTWWGNDQTGIFHPVNNVIGFTLNGSAIARFTQTGLIVGVGHPTTTSHKLQIYDSSAVNTYLQSTNSATGNTSVKGSFFGTDSAGNLSIWGRGDGSSSPNTRRVITLGVGSSQITHKFDENTYSIYGGPIFGGAISATDAYSTNRSRCIRGYASNSQVVTGTSPNKYLFLGSFYLPSANAFFSLELTFTTRVSTHQKVQKQLFLGYLDSSSNMTLFNSNANPTTNPPLNSSPFGAYPNGSTVGGSYTNGFVGRELLKLGSPNADTNIGNGELFFVSSTPRSFEFNVHIIPNTSLTVYGSVSWVMNLFDI